MTPRVAYENACAQFACGIFLCEIGKWSDCCVRAPVSLVALDLPEASSLRSSAQRRSETFRPLSTGARVHPRQSDSPMLPKHFQCRTELLTNGPAFKPLGLLCRRSMNTTKSGFLASSQNAAWLTSEALDRASPCKQRGTPILAWCAAGPRADRQELGETSFWHDVQPPTASACGIKLETFRACIAPRGLRSLDDCICGRPEDVTTWRISSDVRIAPRNGGEQTQYNSCHPFGGI